MDIRDALFGELYELGKRDKDVIVLTEDADAFALRQFQEEFPDRFYNMGVAEQNTMLFATGLAMGGKKVFVYSIIPFITMRCYEQIKAQVCSMNLPVTIIGLGAGLSFGFDGPTHHAMHDIGVMRMLPEMTIYNPSDAATAKTSIQCAYHEGTPHYIRLDKGMFPDRAPLAEIQCVRKWASWVSNGVNIITTGTMLHTVLHAVDGFKVGVIEVYKLKPLPEVVSDLLGNWSNRIITIEEHSEVGGLGDIVEQYISDSCEHIRIALPHRQIYEYGDKVWLLNEYGLSSDAIRNRVKELL